jgi:hypothetical protein
MSQSPRIHPLALRPLALLAVALVAAAAIGQTENLDSPADPDAPATRSCLEAIALQIHDDRPRLQELDFDEDLLREWQESEGETGIGGAGEYVGGAGNRKSFIFRCIFNEQKQKATTARFSVKG